MEDLKRRKTDDIQNEDPTHLVPTFTRVMYYIVSLVMLIGVMTLALVIYWSNVPLDVLSINKEPLPVITKQVNRGELLFYEASYCKKTKADGTIARFLVGDDKEIRLPVQEETGDAVCRDIVVPQLIPTGIEPGTYHIRFIVTYKPNPIREHVEVFASQNFEVK